MKKIGFIGVGVMGKSMVRNLMKNGYELTIYSRTKEKCLDVIEEGAVWCDDIRSCVAGQDVVITMSATPTMWMRSILGKAALSPTPEKMLISST